MADLNINPDAPIFDDEEKPPQPTHPYMDDFDISARLRLIEATAPIYAKGPIGEWIDKLDDLHDWVYNIKDDGINFEPDDEDE